jgi:ADP-ribosyl-[dinitrogen reductase] hydrolase
MKPEGSLPGEVTDRVVGCVLGLALGDALGAPFENLRAAGVPDPIPPLELPWSGGPAGSTTDDTAMARNLVRSLVERGGFDAEDLIARHLAWFRTDPPDVGSLTRRVLQLLDRGELADVAARRLWEERGPEASAGNGSVMYCAPLGAAYAFRPARLFDVAPRLSALTHHDQRCRTAVLSITLAVAALVRGDPPVQAVAQALAPGVVALDGGEELEYLVEAVGGARPVDGPDRGFCLFTAGAALQTLSLDASFEGALRRVVALGGDTDTNGAVAGALLGAALGRSALPQAWLDLLLEAEAIEVEARLLVPLAGPGESEPRTVTPEGLHWQHLLREEQA